MDPHYPEQRLAYMVKDAKAPVLLTHQGLRQKLPEGDLQMQVAAALYIDTSVPMCCMRGNSATLHDEPFMHCAPTHLQQLAARYQFFTHC